MSKNDPQPELPIEGNGDDPPIQPPRITSVSPIGGALGGGIDVTITGSRFQPDAEVLFGSNQSPAVTFVSVFQVTAKLPPATQTGSVDVTLVNSDGTFATRPGGFTYVSTEGSLHAEVLGVTPLAVIEDTESEVTIRGRNLIAAFSDGIVALRGPSRVHITSANFGSSRDEATGIELLTLTVRVTATPPLEQHERIAIQVLASIRPGAAGDGLFESSRQMFTVLPRAVPVALAFTANLDPNKANLVIVAGRNLEGCSLDFGQDATVHLQRSDDQTLAGIVSFPEGAMIPEAAQLTLLDPAGSEAGRFELTVAPVAESGLSSAPTNEAASSETPPAGGDIVLTLTPVPGQQLVGPTIEDSAVFSLSGASLFPSFSFDDFEITLREFDVVIPLFNEVRLIPFFDNGVSDVLNDTTVRAEVGKLFPLRGMGLMVSLRVDLVLHFEVVLIIGFRFGYSPFGFFNEFYDDYPWAIGSIVIRIRIRVSAFLLVSFLVALVKPDGSLRTLFFFNLVLGVDLIISPDGKRLFDGHFIHKVNHTRIGPHRTNMFPCDGRFQLAEENGQTEFTDAFGGSVSFYFPRAAGQCCLPWDFDLELVRFEEGGPEETIQSTFRVDYCLNAFATEGPSKILIVSTRTPPPPLRLDVGEIDFLTAFAVPIDQNGDEIPDAPRRNLSEEGLVEFYLENAANSVLNRTELTPGNAIAEEPGNNVIRVDVTSVRITDGGPAPELFFWPADVLGFHILSFLARGLAPAVSPARLPVEVNALITGEIVVAATLVFKDPTASTAADRDKLNEALPYFTIPGSGASPSPEETVLRLERCEPFEEQPLKYFLAAKITGKPSGLPFPVRLKLKVTSIQMMVFVNNQPQTGTPLEGTEYLDGRPSVNAADRFFSQLPPNQEVTIEFDALNESKELFPITPNLKEEGLSSTRKLVPPGEGVANRKVVLEAKLTAADASSANRSVTQPKPLKLAIHNDENYEEYRRVFTEVKELLDESDPKVVTYRDFAKTFFGELVAAGGVPSAATLGQKGVALWNYAVNAVQTSLVQGTQTPAPLVTLDDRLLYWARLQAIGALKAYYARKQGQMLDDATLNKFEWPSRGLEQNGSISLPATGRKAIVTGFDPFQLDFVIKKTNPSGLAALWLNGKTIDSSQGNSLVRTAIFPVRYKEFDVGLVEKAVRSNLGLIALLMTVSQGSEGFYDVERFAGKNRGGLSDNNNIRSTMPVGFPTTPGPNPNGPEFIESSLPYERVITRVEATRHLPEPQSGPTFTNNDAFIVNQAYKGTLTHHDRTFDVSVDETWKKLPDQPLPYVNDTHKGEVSVFGSGSNYLSNEIFYRTARVRVSDRPALPSGHLHIPPLGTSGNQPSLGPGLVTAVERALQKFLNDKLQLRSLGDVAFPDTVINQPSAALPLKAHNETTAVVEVASIDIDPPQVFTCQTALPARANPSSDLELSFIFTPTDTTTFARIARVKDAAGAILFSAQLRGKGISPQPVNVASASSGAVITAQNFTQDGVYPGLHFQPSYANDGVRYTSADGDHYWRDEHGLPSSIEIDLNGSKTISEIDIFTMADSYQTQADPSATQTFASYGVTAFDVQYWTGTGWATVPGGSITGNNLVWRKVTFPEVTTQKIRVVVNAAVDGVVRIVEVEAWGTAASAPPSTNVALASNGAVATAQNYTQDGVYPGFHFQPSYANDGVRYTTTDGDHYWRDEHGLPSWIQIAFNGSKTISEINIFTMSDSYQTQADPSATQTFASYGTTAFEVQYWTGSAWATVPGGSITGNNLVWRKITFPAVTTQKIRVVVNAAVDGVVRIVEVEAWGTAAAPPSTNVALASNGAVATAQNFTQDGVYPGFHFQPSYANDGVRHTSADGDHYWRDEHGLPSSLEIDLNGSKTIYEIDIFTMSDSYQTQADPSATQTFASYGVTAFDVQYWTGGAWATVPGGSITGNNLVWRKITFHAVTTQKIRVVVNAAVDGVLRIVEVEAWGAAA